MERQNKNHPHRRRRHYEKGWNDAKFENWRKY